MIDVSAKQPTMRSAVARAVLRLQPSILLEIRHHGTPKGNPFEVAKVAAVQAAKETSRIIPYCHPLPIEFVGIEYAFGDGAIEMDVTVTTVAKTGVEMEALTAASVAALTIYDMVKMLDETMEISGIRLLRKSGGKSDFRRKPGRTIRSAVLVMSDSIAAGKGEDRSGAVIAERLRDAGIEVAELLLIPDDPVAIRDALVRFADTLRLDLVVMTGGTGFGPRDNTPEAVRSVIDREVPGISEAIRAYGQSRTPFAIYSRAVSGIRGETLFVSLPGSPSGAEEGMRVILPSVIHAIGTLRGDSAGLHGKGTE